MMGIKTTKENHLLRISLANELMKTSGTGTCLAQEYNIPRRWQRADCQGRTHGECARLCFCQTRKGIWNSALLVDVVHNDVDGSIFSHVVHRDDELVVAGVVT